MMNSLNSKPETYPQSLEQYHQLIDQCWCRKFAIMDKFWIKELVAIKVKSHKLQPNKQ